MGSYTYFKQNKLEGKNSNETKMIFIKWMNLSRKYNNHKYINTYAPNIRTPKYIKQIQINLKAEADNNQGHFNTPFSKMDRIIQKENQQENIGLEPSFRENGANRHIQTIPSNRSRIHILLKHT